MPIVAALVPAAIGAYQLIHGAEQNAQARKAAENMQQKPYAPDRGIQSYYQEALQRANTSPYNSAFMQQVMKGTNRAEATGINALQNRRQAIGGISALTQGAQDAQLKGLGQAVGQQTQAFNTLGRAAQMQAGQNQMAYNINVAQPFQRQFQLALARASGGAQTEQAGISNLAGAAGAAANIYQGQKYNGMDIWGNPINRGFGGTSSTGATLSPQYSNGYGANSNYGTFDQ